MGSPSRLSGRGYEAHDEKGVVVATGSNAKASC
jgi:hypothetical protein